MMWLVSQLWPVALVSLIAGFAITWLVVVRSLPLVGERGPDEPTTRQERRLRRDAGWQDGEPLSDTEARPQAGDGTLGQSLGASAASEIADGDPAASGRSVGHSFAARRDDDLPDVSEHQRTQEHATEPEPQRGSVADGGDRARPGEDVRDDEAFYDGLFDDDAFEDVPDAPAAVEPTAVEPVAVEPVVTAEPVVIEHERHDDHDETPVEQGRPDDLDHRAGEGTPVVPVMAAEAGDADEESVGDVEVRPDDALPVEPAAHDVADESHDHADDADDAVEDSSLPEVAADENEADEDDAAFDADAAPGAERFEPAPTVKASDDEGRGVPARAPSASVGVGHAFASRFEPDDEPMVASITRRAEVNDAPPLEHTPEPPVDEPLDSTIGVIDDVAEREAPDENVPDTEIHGFETPVADPAGREAAAGPPEEPLTGEPYEDELDDDEPFDDEPTADRPHHGGQHHDAPFDDDADSERWDDEPLPGERYEDEPYDDEPYDEPYEDEVPAQERMHLTPPAQGGRRRGLRALFSRAASPRRGDRIVPEGRAELQLGADERAEGFYDDVDDERWDEHDDFSDPRDRFDDERDDASRAPRPRARTVVWDDRGEFDELDEDDLDHELDDDWDDEDDREDWDDDDRDDDWHDEDDRDDRYRTDRHGRVDTRDDIDAGEDIDTHEDVDTRRHVDDRPGVDDDVSHAHRDAHAPLEEDELSDDFENDPYEEAPVHVLDDDGEVDDHGDADDVAAHPTDRNHDDRDHDADGHDDREQQEQNREGHGNDGLAHEDDDHSGRRGDAR